MTMNSNKTADRLTALRGPAKFKSVTAYRMTVRTPKVWWGVATDPVSDDRTIATTERQKVATGPNPRNLAA